MTDKKLLAKFHEKLIHEYGEDPLLDYMGRLRGIIDSLPDDQNSGFSGDMTDVELYTNQLPWNLRRSHGR